MRCQCESAVCGKHGDRACWDFGHRTVRTIYGTYTMCIHCANAMPADFLKSEDQPSVVDRALAIVEGTVR